MKIYDLFQLKTKQRIYVLSSLAMQRFSHNRTLVSLESLLHNPLVTNLLNMLNLLSEKKMITPALLRRYLKFYQSMF